MINCDRRDPFSTAREEAGILRCNFAGELIPMILRHADVRAVAKDWQTFTSDRVGQVPIPNELDIRQYRQLPIELDPPQHAAYRALVSPFFLRPTQPDYIARIDTCISDLIEASIAKAQFEVVREFALPLQSHALALMMGVPAADANEFVSWGVHAFREGGKNSVAKAAVVESYIERRIASAKNGSGNDIFSVLQRALIDDRPLTHDEKRGFVQLALSGGRDTLVNSITSIVGYLGDKPDAFAQLRANPGLINSAVEEFVRWLSPLSHIARVATSDTSVAGCPVAAESRVALCWSSANRDQAVFDKPAEIRLDRTPNPHVGFGSGRHMCLGSAQARLVLRTILAQLIAKVAAIKTLTSVPAFTTNPDFTREFGYETLTVSFLPLLKA